MRKIVYYVATSIDGFICGPDNDVSGFAPSGNGIEKYLSDLKGFDTVIMGRKTYEFGYAYGLQPGQPAYPHMKHYLFSSTLQFENQNEQITISPLDLELIKKLKAQEGTDIYLCGGGAFAGWLLDHEMIDVLKLKLNPLILGDGVPLFGESKKSYQLELKAHEQYEMGLQIITYDMKY